MVALTFKFRTDHLGCQPKATRQIECRRKCLAAMGARLCGADESAVNVAATKHGHKTKGQLNAIARNNRKTDVANPFANVRTFDTINDEARSLAPDGHTIDPDRR